MFFQIAVRGSHRRLDNLHITFQSIQPLPYPVNISAGSLILLALKQCLVLVTNFFQQDNLVIFLHIISLTLFLLAVTANGLKGHSKLSMLYIPFSVTSATRLTRWQA